MIRLLVVLAVLAGPAIAQDSGPSILEPELDLTLDPDLGIEESVEQGKAATAQGAVLRGLDKVSGALQDIELATGQTERFGRLDVTLGECRYPVGNPAGDAFAYLVIRPAGDARPVFEGWMIASSPALNALDHPRYDVWVLRCMTS
jgi:hypothetical protein